MSVEQEAVEQPEPAEEDLENTPFEEFRFWWIPKMFCEFAFPNTTIKKIPEKPTHEDPHPAFWVRKNGYIDRRSELWDHSFSWWIVRPGPKGLPTGTFTKWIIAYITTYAYLRKTRDIPLPSLTVLLRAMGLMPRGGKAGNIQPLKDMAERLLQAEFGHIPPNKNVDYRIDCFLEDIPQAFIQGKGFDALRFSELANTFKIADRWTLWNSKKKPFLKLSEEFYQIIHDGPTTISRLAMKRFRKWPFATDLYCWLNFRARLKPTMMSPDQLRMQMGSVGTKGDFVKQMHKYLPEIRDVWEDLDVEIRPGRWLKEVEGINPKTGKPKRVKDPYEAKIIIGDFQQHVPPRIVADFDNWENLQEEERERKIKEGLYVPPGDIPF